MGLMFKVFFEKRGMIVQSASRNTRLTIEKCAETSDVVIVSVPIEDTIDTIKKIGSLVRKESLLMDFTSIKVKPLETMLEFSKSSVLGVHPMFGPGIKKLKGQTVVLCKGRGENWFDWVNTFFLKEKASIRICTAEEHDRMMVFIQALTHFNSIAIGHLMKEFNFDIAESAAYSTPVFKLQLEIIKRIFSQDSSLYSGIIMDNTAVCEILDDYFENYAGLLDTIYKKDKNGFAYYFNEAATYFNGHLR